MPETPEMRPDIRLPAFLRLDPWIGWRISPISEGVETDPVTRALTLGYASTRLSPLTDGSGAFGGKTLPTGVAVGPQGVVVVADPARGELLVSPHQGLYGPDGDTAPAFVALWPGPDASAETGDCALPATPAHRGPYDLVKPRSVAFSRDGDLLVTDEGCDITPGRLIVYTWPNLRVRAIVPLGGKPWDIEVTPDGRIWIADAGTDRILRLDRAWRLTDFSVTPGILNRPKHLTVTRAGDLHVVDTDPETGHGRLFRIDALGRLHLRTGNDLTTFWEEELPPPIQLRDGLYYAPGADCPDHGPPIRNLVLDRRGRLPQGPVLRYVTPPGRRLRAGTYISAALDGESFGFAWHRLTLDMDLGTAGALEVQSFTSPSYLEPARIADLAESRWSRRIVLTPDMPRELLLQSQPGRYLWLRIRLIGDGVTAPAIRAIDIEGPRRSSLRFLPAPFHEDPEARDFLDRFLSYFDTVFAEVDQRVQRFSAQLGPRGAPEGRFLAWLASWFDIAFLAQWDDATRRAFLSQAMELHRLRGTVEGLAQVLRLHLGVSRPLPVLIEGFRLRQFAERRKTAQPDLPDGSLRIAGHPLTQPLDAAPQAHRFYVVAPAATLPDDTARRALTALVDLFKPAHTAWDLIEVHPGLRVGCQSVVGVDTLLGGYPSDPLGDMTLGQSARLTGPAHRLPALGLGSAAIRGQRI